MPEDLGIVPNAIHGSVSALLNLNEAKACKVAPVSKWRDVNIKLSALDDICQSLQFGMAPCLPVTLRHDPRVMTNVARSIRRSTIMTERWNQSTGEERLSSTASTASYGSESRHPSDRPQQAMPGARQNAGDFASQASDKASEIGNRASDKASDLASQASDKADIGMSKAAQGLDTLASTLREKSETMSDGSMHTIAATAASKLETGADVLRSKDTDELMTELESMIRRKPVESLLVAAGVGFLLARSVR
jgi:ElaB/YqjD/DUF883 family membrane-anchored ribosome-binding protein